MQSLSQRLNEALSKRDKVMWDLIEEINFAELLKEVKSFGDYGKVCDKIQDILQKKIDDKVFTKDDLEDIASNIRGHARTLFDMGGDFWGRGDDGTWDIATAAVALGKENYKKCISNPKHLKSMKDVTKGFENFLYPFNEFTD